MTTIQAELTTGRQDPTVAVSTGIGRAWSNPDNVFDSDDTEATAALLVGETSALLRATDCDFSDIPAGATIAGVRVRVEIIGDADCIFNSVQLFDGTVAIGTDQAAAAAVPRAADTVVIFGGPTNLMGATLTRAIVQAAGFGVQISVDDNDDVAPTIDADHITIEVFYTTTITLQSTIRRIIPHKHRPKFWFHSMPADGHVLLENPYVSPIVRVRLKTVNSAEHVPTGYPDYPQDDAYHQALRAADMVEAYSLRTNDIGILLQSFGHDDSGGDGVLPLMRHADDQLGGGTTADNPTNAPFNVNAVALLNTFMTNFVNELDSELTRRGLASPYAFWFDMEDPVDITDTVSGETAGDPDGYWSESFDEARAGTENLLDASYPNRTLDDIANDAGFHRTDEGVTYDDTDAWRDADNQALGSFFYGKCQVGMTDYAMDRAAYQPIKAKWPNCLVGNYNTFTANSTYPFYKRNGTQTFLQATNIPRLLADVQCPLLYPMTQAADYTAIADWASLGNTQQEIYLAFQKRQLTNSVKAYGKRTAPWFLLPERTGVGDYVLTTEDFKELVLFALNLGVYDMLCFGSAGTGANLVATNDIIYETALSWVSPRRSPRQRVRRAVGR